MNKKVTTPKANLGKLVHRLFNRPPDDPYESGIPKGFRFEESCVVKTRHGNDLCILIKGAIDRIDEIPFKNAKMLEEASQRQLVSDFLNECLLKRIADKGYYFSMYWNNYGGMDGQYNEPVTWLPSAYLFKTEAGTNGRPGAKPMPHELEMQLREPWNKNGCRIRINAIEYFNPVSQIIESNFERLQDKNPRLPKQLMNDERFLAYEEHVVVTALHRRLELERDFLKMQSNVQGKKANGLTVSAESSGNKVKIQWQISNANCAVCGFINKRSFDPDKYSETTNGSLVISDTRSGHTIETLEHGQTYFYTLFLKNENDGRIVPDSSIRFTITIPTEKELQQHSDIVQRLKFKPKTQPIPPPKRELDPFEAIYNAIKNEVKVLDILGFIDGIEDQLLKKIDDQKLPEEEAEIRKERVKAFVESKLRQKYVMR